MNSRAPLVATVLAGAVLAAGAAALSGEPVEDAAVRSGPPTPPPRDDRSINDQLLVERQWLDTAGGRWIGPGYACAVAMPRGATGHYERLVVYVADETAARRTRRVTAHLASESRVLVRRTSPRFRMDVMRRIERKIVDALPSNARNVGVMRVGFMEVRRSDCPPLEITVHRASATPEVDRWIDHAVERFGSDRILIRRSGRNVPATDSAA